jgi:hypothetical protein
MAAGSLVAAASNQHGDESFRTWCDRRCILNKPGNSAEPAEKNYIVDKHFNALADLIEADVNRLADEYERVRQFTLTVFFIALAVILRI